MTTTMEADLPQNKRNDAPQSNRRRSSGKLKKEHEDDTLKFHFANYGDYSRFFACFNELLETAKAGARARTRIRFDSYLSDESRSTDSRVDSTHRGLYL
jgi:hypothetical protein